jgi:hypothetical protein
MILYVNGCSHTAAAEAVNPHAFACDDGQLWQLGRRPHPDNERVSWGYQLAGLLNSSFVNQSESASSNYRILRTATEWIDQNSHAWDRLLVVIQWSTWERQEWQIDGELYQINASGIDQVPESHQDLYRQYVIDINWQECMQYWHDQIWQFHQTLQQHGISHVFFNGNSDFSSISDRKNWDTSYINPYQKQGTFNCILREHGYPTVHAQSWHFGADAHCFWSNYMLQYLQDHKILESI